MCNTGFWEAREMTGWVKALAVLPGDCAVPSTHVGLLTASVIPVPWVQTPFSGLFGHLHAHGIHIDKDTNTHIHKITLTRFFKKYLLPVCEDLRLYPSTQVKARCLNSQCWGGSGKIQLNVTQ